MLKEFKKFITRGNVIDLAVGVIIGAAFNKIVSSLAGDIITPIISYLTGLLSVDGVELAKWEVALGANSSAAIKIGAFFSNIIDFLINAFTLFVIVRTINKIRDNSTQIDKIPVIGKLKIAKTLLVKQQPTKKKCGFCKSEIDIEASRCPFCTSILEEPNNEETDNLKEPNNLEETDKKTEEDEK